MKMINLKAVLALIVASFILLLSLVEVQSETPRRATTSIPSHLKGNGNAIEDWMLSRTQETPRTGITLLSEPRVETGTVTNTLPASLPIGSESQVNDWIVTNRMFYSRTLAFHLIFIDTNRQVQEWWLTSPGQNFTSYESYKVRFVELSTNILKAIGTDPDYHPSSNLWFYAYVKYSFGGNMVPYQGMSYYQKLGTLLEVSEKTFYDMEPEEKLVILPILGLESFKIDVEYIFHYTNTWTIDKFWTYQHQALPYEKTRSQFLILNEWYSLGKHKARFTISAFGQTNTYTQFGERLDEVKLQINDRATHLTINKARGSDVVIQSSADNINWTTMMAVENYITNIVTVPIIPDKKSEYYRAYYY